MTVGIATRGYYGVIDVLGGPPKVGASGGTTTDWATVRQRMVTVIKALTPTSLSSLPWLVTETEHSDFRTYAEELGNSEAVFREYEIEDIEDDAAGVQDHRSELRLMTAELIIAYPHSWGWYRTKDSTNQWNEAALRALAHQDRKQIDNAIGVRGGSNYTSGQSACWFDSVSFEEGENVTFLVIAMTVRFDESAS